MIRGLFFLAGLLLLSQAAAQGPGLAIIIDDVGNDYRAAQQALALPPQVTLAILPGLDNSKRIAEAAHRRGQEVMLHQPMQPFQKKALGPGGFTLQHSREELRSLLDANFATVPHAVGVNNHMGSLMTGQAPHMQCLMQELLRRGNLYFVDSRTNGQTVAEDAARAAGLATARRDVFLDNFADEVYIREQLNRAIKMARRQGTALAIGHPYPETLAVLAQLLPEMQAQGIRLLPVSQLITEQQRPDSWRVSSFPLHKVAKSSKQ